MDEYVAVSPWRRRRLLAVRMLALLVLPALVWLSFQRGLAVAAIDIRTARVMRGVFFDSDHGKEPAEPGYALLLPDDIYPADAGGSWVFVLDGSEARRRGVVLGRRGNGVVEVVSGLEAGEKVIVPPYAEFGDAVRLRITN